MKFFLFVLLLSLNYPLSAQKSIRFQPEKYSNVYSAKPAPVLRIYPGDTVYTTSVDAVGFDQYGKKVAQRGNPLTGPFYVEGTEVGDVVAVTLHDVKLNRDYATTLNNFIPKVLPKSVAKKTWRSARLVKWHLDLAKQTGTPMDSSMHFEVPLRPFLGCVGVAPEGSKEEGSGASNEYGGNMDFTSITSGVTVYLPVFHAGTLLYLGDGHAAQGDGELNGDALETSMRFGFMVRVKKRNEFPLQVPMMEDADYLMFLGIASSLEKSLSIATESLTTWIQTRYNLSLSQASQIIGPVIQYRIPKIAANIAEVVALMPKEVIEQLKRK